MSAEYTESGVEMKKALYGEVISLRTYYEILKKVKSEHEMTHILSIIEDNHVSINFWKKHLRLHNTDNVINISEWVEVEKFSKRALGSVNRDRVGNNLLETEEAKLDNYKRLARSHSLNSHLKNALEQKIIPMQRNHAVILKNVFKGAGK